MADVFGFKVCEEHLRTITDWRASIVPFVKACLVIKNEKTPFMLDMIDDNVWPFDGGEHIALFYPTGETDWSMVLALWSGYGLPLMLELNGGIEVITDYLHKPLPHYRDDLDHVRFILSGPTISWKGYEHLLRLGWTLDRARQYEYIIQTSSIAPNDARVRLRNEDQWVKLDRPLEEFDF